MVSYPPAVIDILKGKKEHVSNLAISGIYVGQFFIIVKVFVAPYLDIVIYFLM